MKAVITRCTEARVTVTHDDGTVETVGELPEPGLLMLVGVTHDDGERDAEKIVNKTLGLRILADETSVLDRKAPVLVVSQFTLYGNVRKGRRPSWSKAAGRAVAEPMVNRVVELLREAGVRVETGRFGAMMQVHSVNDGPFTVLLDSAELA